MTYIGPLVVILKDENSSIVLVERKRIILTVEERTDAQLTTYNIIRLMIEDNDT